MSRWYFEPILDSFTAVFLLAAFLIALLLISPTFRRLTRRQRMTLVSLRFGLIMLVTVAMLRPSFMSTRSEPQSASLVIAYDQSKSLDVADESDGKTRWDKLKETLVGAATEITQLESDFDVKAISFDHATYPRKISEGTIEIQKPVGEQTDIGFALAEIVKSEFGNRVAGVVLLTDGAQRVHQSRVDLQQTVREMARLGYPLYTITIGQTRDQSQSRDVWVQNLQDQYSVFVKNELLIRSSVLVQGYVNRPIPVRMEMETPSGKKSIVASKEINATEDNQQIPINFSFTPDEVGQHKLQIIADEQRGEIVTDNNRLAAYVNVLDGGIRILMLNGNYLQEQKFLRWSIGMSPDIQLDERQIDIRFKNQSIDLRQELQEKYDVFIINDVNANLLGEENSKQIAKKVENGAGLIMTGGFYSFGPGEYEKNAIGEILPIQIKRFAAQGLGPEAAIRTDLHISGSVQMIPSRRHFITRLGPQAENDAIWRQLKPLLGANKFSGVKDRATVLARSESGAELLVAWPFGEGRVLAFAGDSTYLWWKYGQQTAHKRFWRQCMLWLAKKDEFQNQDVWIQLEKRRYYPGEEIRFTAGARGVEGDPIAGATIRAELVIPDANRKSIPVTPEGDDWAGLFAELLEAGEYKIEVVGELDGVEIGRNSSRFELMNLDLELSDPAANPEQMKLLASLTGANGGKSVPPEQFNQLLNEMLNSPPEMEIEVQSTWQFGDTQAGTWTFFMVAFLILSVEWYLRKKWQMV